MKGKERKEVRSEQDKPTPSCNNAIHIATCVGLIGSLRNIS